MEWTHLHFTPWRRLGHDRCHGNAPNAGEGPTCKRRRWVLIWLRTWCTSMVWMPVATWCSGGAYPESSFSRLWPSLYFQPSYGRKCQIPSDYVVERAIVHRKSPEVRIWRLNNQSRVGTV